MRVWSRVVSVKKILGVRDLASSISVSLTSSPNYASHIGSHSAFINPFATCYKKLVKLFGALTDLAVTDSVLHKFPNFICGHLSDI